MLVGADDVGVGEVLWDVVIVAGGVPSALLVFSTLHTNCSD